ncbi:hypothetical protein, partial [Pseudolactococcus raffinolactis]|uniref:hypothetical protein n=1 Tax=Pseudolactococcus raffinolactis TaxID=1366 RepID=UPI00289AE710
GCFFVKWYNGSYIAGLLFQIKQGFDPKKKKNLPNRLYLADLEVTAKDVYIKQDFANKTAETLDTSGLEQMRHNLYKTNLDTNKDTKQLLKDLYEK